MSQFIRAQVVGYVRLLVAFGIVLASANPALAGSWRCGSRLIGEGQTIDEVYDRCGEPTERVASTEFVTFHVRCDVDVTRTVPMEQWTYDRGPKQFIRYLVFRNGILIGIEEGSYGH
jgi:hypothetical protein